jgi:uncharacterized alkaline shock family protein YloU
MYGVYTVFLAGKSPNIRSHTVQIYGHIRCKCTVTYGANIRSHTVQMYGHIRCKCTVTYGANIRSHTEHIYTVLANLIHSDLE